MRIVDLRTEYRSHPQPVDTEHPRFSWRIESDRRGVRQTGYTLVVKKDGREVCRLENVASSQSQHVAYEGEPLEPLSEYHWQVEVQTVDQDGAVEQAVSEEAVFHTAVTDRKLFQAEWILPAEQTEETAMMPVQYLRKTFEVKAGLKSAKAVLTAHGIYECFLNGTNVTEERFLPGFTVYYKRLQYHTFEVREFLKEGTNLWAVALADGWWRGTTGGDIRNNFGTRTAFYGELLLEYEDGTKELVVSDDSFVSKESGIREADMKLGEVFDASLEPAGWKEASYDDSGWTKVTVAQGEHYGTENLVAAAGAPVLPQEKLHGKVFYDAAGDLILDFGQNIAGNLCMTFRNTTPGQHITVEFGEDMKDGVFYTDNIAHGTPIPGLERFQQIDYYAEGKEEECYENRFSVFGFQYVRIRGYQGEILPDDFVAQAIYSDCDYQGSFSCSDERVNQLVSNSRWSQKGNFLDVPTDCPTRERSPWTGDSQIYAKTAGWFANVYTFFEKWMKDVAADQCPNGKILNIAPNCMMPHDEEQVKKAKAQMEQFAKMAQENPEMMQDPGMALMAGIYAEDGAYIIDGSSGWGDTAVITPWVMYQRYGDLTILKNQYASAKAWVEYERTNAKNKNQLTPEAPWYAPEAGDDGQYIWDTRYQWGEWLEPDLPNAVMSGADAILKPDPEVPTAYLCHSSEILSKIAELLGYEEDAKEYAYLAQKVRSVYGKYFIGQDGKIKENRQAPQVRALAFRLYESEEQRKAIAAYLNEIVVKNEYTLNTGFLSTAELLNMLAENGYADTAYRVLLQENCPGWLYNVLQGATTVPETWDGKKTHKESMNHYSYGAVCDFLFQECCGIHMEEAHPGFTAFRIQPVPTEHFTFARAEHNCLHGKIVSAWERDEQGTTTFLFEIPANTTAEIVLPDGRREKAGSGEYRYRVESGDSK